MFGRVNALECLFRWIWRSKYIESVVTMASMCINATIFYALSRSSFFNKPSTACSFRLNEMFHHKNITIERLTVTTKYSQSHQDTIDGSLFAWKSKEVVLKKVWRTSVLINIFAALLRTAVNVAGKITVVLAAITRMAALSREAAIATRA